MAWRLATHEYNFGGNEKVRRDGLVDYFNYNDLALLNINFGSRMGRHFAALFRWPDFSTRTSIWCRWCWPC